MYLLITTNQTLLGWNAETGAIDILDNSRFGYYGLSWPEDGSRLVMSHAYRDDRAPHERKRTPSPELGYLTCGHRTSQPFLSAVHQILCIGDRWVVATNTGRNSICRIQLDDFLHADHRYDGVFWDIAPGADGTEEHVGRHYNSLFFRDGLLWVLAHNFFHGSRAYLLEWPTMAKLDEIPGCSTGMHNIWVQDDGQILSCDSNQSSLVDFRSGDVLWHDGSSGHLRGLAATADTIFIGRSEMSERALRGATESGVWVVDRKTLKTIDYIALGMFGNVREVRIADEPDECHHGHPLGREALPDADAGRRRLREERLRIHHAHALRRRLDFSTWNVHCGMLTSGNDDIWRGQPDRLTLATLRHEICVDGMIEAEISLADAKEEEFVSLVGRHRGREDGEMVMALIRRDRLDAIATILVHDGSAWKDAGLRRLNGFWTDEQALQLPTCVRLTTVGSLAVLRIGEEDVLSVPIPEIAWSGGFGVRVLGDGPTVQSLRGGPVSEPQQSACSDDA